MARRLRVRSAGHPTDATMGSTVSAALGYRCSPLQDEATRGGHHRFSLLTNQRTLVREELVGRTDHHGTVEFARMEGHGSRRGNKRRRRHPKPPSPQGRAPPATPPGRRGGLLRQHQAQRPGQCVLVPASCSIQVIGRVDSFDMPEDSSRGPAHRGAGSPRHLRVRQQSGNRTRQGRPRRAPRRRHTPSRTPPRAHITTTTTHTAPPSATPRLPPPPAHRHRPPQPRSGISGARRAGAVSSKGGVAGNRTGGVTSYGSLGEGGSITDAPEGPEDRSLNYVHYTAAS